MINIFIFLFLGTLGWGVSLYLIKILLLSLTPTEIVLYRSLIGAASLFLMAKFLRLKVDKLKTLVQDGAVVGIFNMALPFYLTTVAEKTVPSSLASVINGLTPLCAFLLSFFFAPKEKFNFFNLLSILLGLLGIVLVNFDARQEQGEGWALLALVLTSFCYGFAANYVKTYVKTKEPILVAAMAAAITSVLMLVSELGSGSILHWGKTENLAQGAALLWLGVVGTGLSLYLYCLLIKRAGALTASLITYLMTVTGILMGMIFLEEKISSLAWIGCLCLVISLVSVNHAHDLQRVFARFLFKKTERQVGRALS